MKNYRKTRDIRWKNKINRKKEEVDVEFEQSSSTNEEKVSSKRIFDKCVLGAGVRLTSDNLAAIDERICEIFTTDFSRMLALILSLLLQN